jgi:hypothetical protein
MDRSESFGEPDIEMVDETDTQTSNTDYLKTAQRVLQEAKESNGSFYVFNNDLCLKICNRFH